MPLYYLGPIVVFGILGIALLLHVLGNSRRLRMQDAGQVRHLWLAQYPDTTVAQVEIADSGHQALVVTDQGPGLVWAMGADAACRLVPRGCEIRNTGKGLQVRLRDYTAPVVKIVLADGLCHQWKHILTGGTNV
jgi:hypothetical protein